MKGKSPCHGINNTDRDMGVGMQSGLVCNRAEMSCFGLVFYRNHPRCEEFHRSRRAQRKWGAPDLRELPCSPPPVANMLWTASCHLYSAPRLSRLLEGRDEERENLMSDDRWVFV